LQPICQVASALISKCAQNKELQFKQPSTMGCTIDLHLADQGTCKQRCCIGA